ncbi:MAG: Nif3-like dinuclear metal center hexameric protein [Actinobacteria bacterium]|nr:MAG: Nif3-like dinuclear metal center hexameric protein [Actinomycetota bacterium]
MSLAPTTDLIGHLDALLKPAEFDDYGPNGLQVPGKDAVGTLVTGVSASIELFERAIEHNADLVLVHHGLFWGETGPVDAQLKRRLKLLFDHDLALAAYHLPLDAHPEVGNNALLAGAIGATEPEPFAGVGVRARLPEIAPEELRARVREATGGREPLAFLAGPDPVRTIGIVSGAAARSLDDAVAQGLDAFVTGEPREPAMNDAREAGIHFLAAGHYATETFGVRALGDRLAAEFGIRHVFADIPNPI